MSGRQDLVMMVENSLPSQLPRSLMKFHQEIPTVVIHEPDHGRWNWYVRSMPCFVGGEVKFACVDGPEFDGHLVDFDQAMKRQQQYKTEEGRAKLLQ